MGLGTFFGGPIRQLRGIEWFALSETGHIGVAAAVDDLGGGSTFQWTYGLGIPCRIDPLGSDERVIGARLSDRTSHVVTVPAGTVVAPENRFVIDGRGTFEITAVQQRTGELAGFFEVVQVT